MIKIDLFDKSEEIYNSLPKRYADIILNSIIAQSLSKVSKDIQLGLHMLQKTCKNRN